MINDALPPEVRQRLKPFAVRIVGTRDGCDRARAEVLRQALATEILPRIRRDWGIGQAAERCHLPLGSLFAGPAGLVEALGWAPERRMALLLAQLERDTPPGYEPCLGSAIGELLARCMRDATTQKQRGWYWDEAIILLDRLCDIGPQSRRQVVQAEQITRAEQRLGSSWLGNLHRLLPANGRAGQAF